MVYIDDLQEPEDSFLDDPELVQVEYARLISETEKARLLEFPDLTEHWFPKSQCAVSPSGEYGGYLQAPEWMLIEKEIEYEG